MKNLVVQMKQSGYLSCDGNISKENIAEMSWTHKSWTQREEKHPAYTTVFLRGLRLTGV